ncbi:MAG TPA: DNA-binding response regulator, partial [Polyangia bacterium]
ELRAALGRLGAGQGLLDSTLTTLDVCDHARFAPGSLSPEEASAAIDRASEIIEEFEKLQSNAGGST